MKKLYKKILIPVTVSAGDHCWEGSMSGTICSHFDNEGGHGTCGLGINITLTRNEDGSYSKPAICKNAEEAK